MASQNNGSQIDVVRLRASEVDRLETAVGGLCVEYVRTDGGEQPSEAIVAGTPEATLTLGKVGFSVIANCETPRNSIVLALITAAPPGAKWNGVHLQRGDVFAFAPQTTFFGVEPASCSAAILVVPAENAAQVASDLRAGDPVVDRGVTPLPPSPAVKRFAAGMWRCFEKPRLLGDSRAVEGLVEDTVRVLTHHEGTNGHSSRRLNSRAIVRDCLDWAESTDWRQPSMGALCRVAFASESRVRQAFIDVVGVPPNRYFQMQRLSRVRSALVDARPKSTSVTDVAMSLGVTQFGRLAGRYRALYGELPSQTLRRLP